jgi:hypothetical protein
LSFDALQFAITMCLELMEKIANLFSLVNLIDDDSGIVFDLVLFTSIKREVCGVLDFFI